MADFQQIYNLVTQQDSETNTAIARSAKTDSESMAVIAILTMIFLPATAVSGFFSMSFFSGESHVTRMSGDWWLFLAVALPMTFALFIIWYFLRRRITARDATEKLKRKTWIAIKSQVGEEEFPRWRSGSSGATTLAEEIHQSGVDKMAWDRLCVNPHRYLVGDIKYDNNLTYSRRSL